MEPIHNRFIVKVIEQPEKKKKKKSMIDIFHMKTKEKKK